MLNSTYRTLFVITISLFTIIIAQDEPKTTSTTTRDGITSSAAPEIKTFALDPDLKGAVSNSVNLFTGDVNLPINLVTLPGPNGMDVNVTAVYNSNIQNQVDTWNVEAPTGVLGLGWNLDYPKIVRDHKNTGTRHDDDFYLISGGSSSQLIRIGQGYLYYLYKLKNNPNVIIKYYLMGIFDAFGDQGHWEITTDTGIKQIFGDTEDSKQIGVKWENWIGNSVRSTGQIEFVTTWNLSSIEDQWGNHVKYEYYNVKEYVGETTNKCHTKACYIKRITDVYNRTIEFMYGDKHYDENIKEFQDPHQEYMANNEFESLTPIYDSDSDIYFYNTPGDAYQEKIETKYLDELNVFNENGNLINTIEFEFDFATIENNYPEIDESVYRADLYKRYLTDIVHKNPDGDPLPSINFEYCRYNEETNVPAVHFGAIKTIYHPQGGISTYLYEEKTIEVSNREFVVTQPTPNYTNPKVHIGVDYVVVTWENGNQRQVSIYQWIGEWTNVYSYTFPYSVDIKLSNNFIVIKQGISKIHLIHKNNQNDNWLSTSIIGIDDSTSISNPGECDDELTTIWEKFDKIGTGDNYVAILYSLNQEDSYQGWLDDPDGHTDCEWFGSSEILDQGVRIYTWNDISWEEEYFPLDYTPTTIEGSENHFFVHNKNGGLNDLLDTWYMDESREWNFNGISLGLNIGSGYAGWYINKNMIGVQTESTSEKIGFLNQFYSGFQLSKIFSVDHPEQQLYMSQIMSISLDDLGSTSPTIPLFCFRAVNWFESWFQLPSRSKLTHVTLGEKVGVLTYWRYSLEDGNQTTNKYIRKYWNPNSEHLSTYTSIDDGITDKKRYVEYANNGYCLWYKNANYNLSFSFPKFNGVWDSQLIPNNNTIKDVKSGFNFIAASTSNATTKLYYIKNGKYSSLLNESITGRFSTGVGIDENERLCIGNTLVTFEADELAEATSLVLHRIVDNSSEGLQNDLPVTSIEINDGSQTILTYFDYNEGTATYDPSGTMAQYNKVSVHPGGIGSGHGYTENYFINGVDLSSPCLPTDPQFEQAYTHYKLMMGMPYKTVVYSGDSTPIEVSRTENDYTAYDYDITRDDGVAIDKGYFVRQTRQESITDNVVTSVESTYDQNTGYLVQTQTTNSNGDVFVKSFTHFKDVYPGVVNMKAPVVQTITTNTRDGVSTTTASSASVWKNWGEGKWAPQKSYTWDGTGSSIFTDWSGDEPTSGWIKTSEVLERTSFGSGYESIDVNGNHRFIQWDSTELTPEAVFSNANMLEADFEGYEDETSIVGWTKIADNQSMNSQQVHTGEHSWEIVSFMSRDPYDYAVSKAYSASILNLSNTYVFSAWIWAPETHDEINIQLKYEDSAGWHYPTGNSKAFYVAEEAGNWQHLEVSLDLSEISSLVQVQAIVRNYGSNQIPCYLDDITFRPIDSGFSATVIDPETRLVTAKLGNSGETMRYIYDDFNRVIATVGPDENVNNLTVPYYSRQGNGDEYNPLDPNSVLTITAQNGGIYDNFNDGDIDGWEEDASSYGSWIVNEEGALEHTGADQSDRLLLVNSPTENYGVRCKVKHLNGAEDLGIMFGNMHVRYGFDKYDIRINGVTIAEDSNIPLGEDWVAWVNGNQLYLYVDGKQVFDLDHESVQQGALKLYTGENGTHVTFDDIVVFDNPIISTQYADGMGKVIQSQTIDGDGVILSMPYYDDLGRQAVNFKPIKLDSHTLYYHPELVTSFDWANGSYDGQMNDFHDDDGGFNYTRKIFDNTPLSRVTEEGLPGSDFNIGSGHEITYEYTPDAGDVYVEIGFDPTIHRIQKITNSDDITSVVIKDKLGKTLLKQLKDETTPTTYVYDEYGNVETIYLPNYYDETILGYDNFKIEMTYDHFGRMKTKTTPDAGTSTYIYNENNGQLRFMQDALGASGNRYNYFKYDDLGRVLEEGYFVFTGTLENLQNDANNFPDYPSDQPTWRKKYHYDRNGESGLFENLKGRIWRVETNNDDVVDSEVIETFTYDLYGNILQKDIQVIQYHESNVYSTQYEYDLMGNVTKIHYPDGETTVVYTYNHLGQLISVGSEANPEEYAMYTYNIDGSMNTEMLNETETRQFTYNSQGWLTDIVGTNFEEHIDYIHGYLDGISRYDNNIGNITETFTRVTGTQMTTQSRYQYDNYGQMTGYEQSIIDDKLEYISYDPNGNILTKGDKTYTYHSGTNKVQNTDGSGDDYIYDANGNVTVSNPKYIKALQYDPYSQMTTRIEKNLHNLSFHYDGANRRVFKEYSYYLESAVRSVAENPEEEDKYIKTTSKTDEVMGQYDGYDDTQIIGKMIPGGHWEYLSTLYLHGENEYPLVEYTKGTSLTETKQVFIYGATGLVASKSSTDTNYYVKDHLGSTRVVFNETGGIVTSCVYRPFGSEAFTDVNANGISYTYTGQEDDNEIGLMNYRARMYDAELGRFYAMDPAGQFASPYLYAANNPIVMVDPDGEFIIEAMIIGGFVNVFFNAKNIEDGWDLIGYAAIGAASGLIGACGTPANWALNTAIGAFQGGIAGGLNASLTAKDWSAFDDGFKTGAIAGGIGGFLSSEATKNFLGGDGFVNNQTLFDSWNDGTEQGYKKILDKWDTEANFISLDDKSFEGWKGSSSDSPVTKSAVTNTKTGQVTYNENAFNNGYDKFKLVKFHEQIHKSGLKSGKNILGNLDAEELRALKSTYRNQGLFPNHGIDIMSQIDTYGFKTGDILYYVSPTGAGKIGYSEKWWHLIYKLPRRY